jgi:hypothetical protein
MASDALVIEPIERTASIIRSTACGARGYALENDAPTACTLERSSEIGLPSGASRSSSTSLAPFASPAPADPAPPGAVGPAPRASGTTCGPAPTLAGLSRRTCVLCGSLIGRGSTKITSCLARSSALVSPWHATPSPPAMNGGNSHPSIRIRIAHSVQPRRLTHTFTLEPAHTRRSVLIPAARRHVPEVPEARLIREQAPRDRLRIQLRGHTRQS